MLETSRLLQRSTNEPLAWLTQALGDKPTQITGQQFLSDVALVAQRLPDNAQHVINLCDNRYVFLVSICAVIVRKQCNLLPPNKNVVTQLELHARYQDSYIVHDGSVELAPDINSIDLSEFDWSNAETQQAPENPQVALDHIALISFTSGSTGESKANIKTWRTLQQSSAINAQHMLPDQERTFYHLATVPGQHMWGLETSVIMALFANVCLVDARPLFPHDILQTLVNMPSPKILIATPLHLRALSQSVNDSAQDTPELACVLTATAPVDSALATRVEAQFSTTVREVYGCSEVGSMAWRAPSKSNTWNGFKGLGFEQTAEHRVTVSSDYLPAPVVLDDSVNLMKNRQFTLEGRNSDQIKIAGKRGSLYDVNRVLNTFDGLVDGVVIFPEQSRLVPRLVAIVVLSDIQLKQALQTHFREHLDAAFVPRPIFVVDKLPRQENGKLNKAGLNEFYQQLSAKKS